MRAFRQRRPARRSWLLGPSLALALALAGCGREPRVSLAELARPQRDHVTTRLVPAHSELAGRLAADGWRVDRDDAGETWLRTTRDRARLWFYSRDGKPFAAELYGRVVGAEGKRPRKLFYRLNENRRRIARRSESEGLLTARFDTAWTRPGWNTLDLFVERRGRKAPRAALELRGFRIVDGLTGGLDDEAPRSIETSGGEMRTPGESLLRVAFEVPPEARFKARVTSDLEDDGGDILVGRLRLIDKAGTAHDLEGFRLDAGDTDRLDVDLTPWSGQLAELEIAVDGPRASSMAWRDAGIFGAGESQAGGPPIRPAAAPGSGRLGRPDVVWIVLDAARADAFGAYGAERPTPVVDALAAAGTRFERAIAPSSWTGQSIPALLTGFHSDTLHTERWGDPLPEQVPHVAELMAAAGYRTVLWSQHPIYYRNESMRRGFEYFRYTGRNKRTSLPGRRVLFEPGRATFALIHLLPPHSPYYPPKPFHGAYTSGYRGKFSERLGALGRKRNKRLQKLSAGDRAYILDRYLENVAFADWLVGQVLAILHRTRRFDDALVIVTSDHGEAFLEHGQFLHSRELYREFLEVPLVVKWPQAATGFAASVPAPATLIDLVPTLVDGLGLAGAERGFQGRSLLPTVFDGAPLERSLYATTRGIGDTTRMPRPRWLLEEAGWRLIHDPVADRNELFESAADPGELDSRTRERPRLAGLLLQRLLMQRRFNLDLLELDPRAAVELDPELARELEALGYL